ncbi:dockerin type I repeat-containing protein [Ruminococcus sp.]|uniref:dockerin type I repeat-containing protein n=1 Tax=Ruminococcus sp. TaxID=41978 RepID=UPI003F07AB05
MSKRKMKMKKSNVIITAIFSITILLGFALMPFVNSYNAASDTTPVAENNYYAPGFEEDEALDENTKADSTDINKSENPAIQSTENKNAHTFTLIKSNGLTNSSVTEATTAQAGEFMLGDVDRNGEISIADATHIQKMIAYLIEPTPESNALADVNADNKVNILDATLIQMYCSGLIDSFAGSEPATEPTNPIEDTTANTETSTSVTDSSDLPPKAPVQNGEWGVSVKNL